MRDTDTDEDADLVTLGGTDFDADTDRDRDADAVVLGVTDRDAPTDFVTLAEEVLVANWLEPNDTLRDDDGDTVGERELVSERDGERVCDELGHERPATLKDWLEGVPVSVKLASTLLDASRAESTMPARRTQNVAESTRFQMVSVSSTWPVPRSTCTNSPVPVPRLR